MKSYLLNLILLAVAAALPSSALADKGGNGGDPMTGQFIIMAKQLAVFYTENPFSLSLPFKATEFARRIDVIEASLKDPKQRHLVEFTDDKLFDKNHVEKPAVYEDQKNSDFAQIKVHRKDWASFTNEQRLVQINMEVFGIMKVKNRYQLAENLVRDHVAVIVSIPLADDGAYHKPGWRIVGQDPDQFGRVTEDDVLIDGGSLGLGSAMNKRVDLFFAQPSGDSQWFSAIMKAWRKGRPAYLLLNTPDGNNASITALYAAKVKSGSVVVTYSLLITKFRQIYGGPCSGDASGLKALEKIKNCYLDISNYRSHDTLESKTIASSTSGAEVSDAVTSVMASLHGDLLSFYADDQDNLAAALRGYYITDFSPTVPSYEVPARMAAVQAFGLVSSFEGPFDHVPFWKQTGHKDVAATRLYEATKALGQLDLVFVDSNLRCVSFQGPKLVSRQEYNQNQGHCVSTNVGQSFPDTLYQTMVQTGFRYNYARQQWVQASKPVGRGQ